MSTDPSRHHTTFNTISIYHFAIAFSRRLLESSRLEWKGLNSKKRTILFCQIQRPSKKKCNDREDVLDPYSSPLVAMYFPVCWQPNRETRT